MTFIAEGLGARCHRSPGPMQSSRVSVVHGQVRDCYTAYLVRRIDIVWTDDPFEEKNVVVTSCKVFILCSFAFYYVFPKRLEFVPNIQCPRQVPYFVQLIPAVKITYSISTTGRQPLMNPLVITPCLRHKLRS